MPKPRRNILAAAEETMTPPDALGPAQQICRVKAAAGNNLYHVLTVDNQELLVELAQKFRSTIWIKRGNFVVVDSSALADRDNKIGGEIINVVRDEKAWAKMRWWPASFKVGRRIYDDSDDDDSNVGKMPPSDSEEED